ncbi:MAG: ATP-binding protein, partial [Anaerotignum sp.]|nr:ATP-binding protein [Anaerotignum sp.]
AEGVSPKENAKRNLKMAMAFAEDFTGDNLLLYGGAGRGKTFLCNCIAKDVLERGKTVLYLTAGQLFRQLEEMRFRREEDEEESKDWDNEILTADLLIIDDLGTEFATMFTASELFRIINDRKLRRKPVVISTNLDYRALMDQYSDRVMSRLIGEYTTLKFFGDDIRMKKKYTR